MFALFGDPNDYVWKLGNLSAYSMNSPIYWMSLTSTVHDRFRAVAIDSQASRIYYGSNALGVIASSRFHVDNTTEQTHYLAPPITKVVNLTVVSLH